jgi:NADH-quinone oxidoreductase subunit C
MGTVAITMEPDLLIQAFKDRFPQLFTDATVFAGQASITMDRASLLEILRWARETSEISLNHLADLTGIDYQDKKKHRFAVIYQLLSIHHGHSIRIKVEIPEDDCAVDSAVCLWNGANWLEREVYDLMGIEFRGHPDLRRILMPEDWVGHPLRKDYPLQSDLGDLEWKGFKDVVETAKNNRQYEVDECHRTSSE